jgi:hypothetical protein
MTSFKIISAVWGCPKEWLIATMDSVATQHYSDAYHCMIVDEALKRPDIGAAATFNMAMWQNVNGYEGRIIEHFDRRGIVQNQWEAIHQVCESPDDVVVWVDGDGDLLMPGALDYLDKIYFDSDIQLTYGSYKTHPASPGSQPARPWPPAVIHANSYREHARFGSGICHNHLRTMKYELIQKMNESDMKRADGTWLMGAADSAFMFPALELSQGRSHFIERVLLDYHADHEFSDWKNGENWCDTDNHEILTRPPK